MTYAIKHNTKCQAWELGSGSEMEQSMISQGRICAHPNGVYEIFSLEAQDGKGQIAKAGDYFKVEYRGWPQPCNREWFLQNHKHLEGDWYKQIAKPLKIWRKDDPELEEIRFLREKGILQFHPEDPERYFTAFLWNTEETAAQDAVIVFFDVKRDSDGKIEKINFNFVDAEYFQNNYSLKIAYEMEYKHPVTEQSSIEMIPYSKEYQDRYRQMYNACYHEMREALDIPPFDYIQDDSFFASGMDQVWLLVEKNDIVGSTGLKDEEKNDNIGSRNILIGSVALKGEEIDDLIVDCQFQGKGYGCQILLWALQHMKTERIVLHVAEWNQRAMHLYQNNGFEITKKFEI